MCTSSRLTFVQDGGSRPIRRSELLLLCRARLLLTAFSQFMILPIEDRLQFLSWLFEGALRHCVPVATAKHNPSMAKENSPLSADIMNGHAFQNPAPCNEIGIEVDETEYEVERILKHRLEAHGFMSYLVKWKDYVDAEATLEPYDSV